MRVNEKMRKALSILLCLCMLLQNAPVMAFAATADNLCEHHTEHTAECGYREGSPGSACTHAHSEDCYAIVSCLHTCGDACANGCVHDVCTVESGCITRSLDCHHVHGNCGYSEGTAEVPCSNADTNPECDHSGDCGYTPATEGTPCTHVCEVKVDSADSCYKLLCSHKDGGHDDACGYAAAVEAQECHYECAECAAAPASEEPSEEPSESDPVCTCEVKCTEGSVDSECAVCSAAGADLSGCTGEEPTAEATRVIYVDESGFFMDGGSYFFDADENMLTVEQEELENGWVKYTLPASVRYYLIGSGGGSGGEYPELPANADTYDPSTDTWSCSHPGYGEGFCTLCGEACPGHTGGTATCTTQAVCTVCGASYGELNTSVHTTPETYDYENLGNGKHSVLYDCCKADTGFFPRFHSYDAETKKCVCGLEQPPSVHWVVMNPITGEDESYSALVEIGAAYTPPSGYDIYNAYDLAGWYTEPDGKGTLFTGGYMDNTGDKTYYAHYVVASGSGGSGGGVGVLNMISVVTNSDNPEILTRFTAAPGDSLADIAAIMTALVNTPSYGITKANHTFADITFYTDTTCTTLYNGTTVPDDLAVCAVMNWKCASLTKHDETEDSCTEGGVSAYWSCSCGKYYSDADGINLIKDLDAWKEGDGKISGHNYVNGVCSRCGDICSHIGNTNEAANNGGGTHSFACSVCNTAVTEDHTIDPATGKCVCGAELAVASVTKSVAGGIVSIGATTYYETLDEAIQAVSTCTAGDKAEVKLLENLTLTETITISGGVFTLDLNTKNVVFQTATVGFEISGGEVTFAGNGTVTKDDGTVIVVNTGAVAAIRGGTYDGAVALANYATATVSGGTLKGSGFGIRNTGDLTISNGEVSSYQKNTSNPYDVTAIISSGGRITVTGGTLKAGRFGMLMYQDGAIDLSGFGGAEGVTIWRDDLSTVEMDASDVMLPDGFGLFDENGTQQTGSIEEGTMLTVKQLHVHEWSYAASGDTITATCEGAIGTCPNKTVTIRLKAPENLVYDGTAKTVTVIQSPAGVFADIPAVVYDGDCKNYGTHYANLTYGGETARLGFTIEKATISNVSLDVTAPEAGAAPQNTVAGGTGYSAAIRWNLAAEKFGYNTSYTATVTMTADGNHKFADGITVDGWKVQNTNGILTLTRTFDATRKAKLQSITDAPGNVKLKAYCTEAAGAIAELPGTVTYTAESGSVTVGIQWTCENYNSTTRETNTFVWAVRDGGLDNHDVNSIATSGTITVTNMDPLSVTNTGSNDEITYDGSTYDVSRMFTIDPNAGKAYYSIAGGTGIGSLDGPILTVIKAGTFQIVLYTEANGPYDKGRAIATLTVNKGDFKVTVSIEGWTYGEKPNAPTSNGPGEVTYTYDNETGAYGSTEPPTDAGSWVVLATYTGDDLYKSASAYTRFTIAKKAMTITANDNTITYGDEPEANGVTGNGFAYIESLKDLSGELTYSFDYVRYGDVGAYTITPAGLTSRNYDITFLPGTLTVNPRPATVTANPVSKAYGDADPALTYAVSGLVNGDKLAGTPKRTEGEIPGTYTIGQNTLTAGDNYTLTFKGADFTISKRNVTVTAEYQTIVYGKAISAAAFTAENLVDSHNVTVTLTPSTAKVTANGTITASAAVITADGADVTANYNVSYTSGKLVIAPDTAAIDGLTTENVTSEDEEAIKAVEEMLESADSLTEEWKTLGENCEDLLDRIKEVEAEQKELTDAADAFDEDTVKSTELEELEQLAKEIEDLLDTDNLTEDEREALETVLEQVEGMIDTIEDTAEDSKAATEKIDELDPATVTSDDKDELEQAIETIDELLKDDHLTEDERKALEDAKADAEALIDVIEAAQEATDTENTEKVEDVTADNVKPEDKEALEDAKADLEKALEDNAGNYTEEEKQVIRDEIQRIDDAMVALDNVEDVTDSITQLPETVEPDDEKNAEKIQDAKEAYDDLTDHEKSLVDEDTKKKLDDLVASLTAYDIIKGDGSKWTKGSSSGLTFTANGPFSKFVGIEVDGKEVDEKYYDAKAGSTIITLKSSFLKWRSVGEHTITVLYTDGETTGTFKILAASSSPATGDNSNIMLWSGVLGVSTLGLVVLLADRKRRISTK